MKTKFTALLFTLLALLAVCRSLADGTTPSRTNGTTYTGPVSISATTTLKAVAFKDYYVDSAVTTGTYTITGGGSGTWYNNFDPTLADGETGILQEGYDFGGKITATASGNCTKIRFRCSSIVGDTYGKIALYTTSGTVLGSGTYTGATAGAWVEVTITSVAVTSGTTYVVLPMSSPTGHKAAKRTQSSMGVENYDQVYSSFPTSATLVTNNNQVCVGLYIL